MAQSGRMRSVVMTCGAFADREVVRRLPAPSGDVNPCELRDDDDDIAEATAASEWPWVWFGYESPRRNGGGSYVTPNSGCTQKGHCDGSDTSRLSSSGRDSVDELGLFGSACSGGCGSGLLICTKHSEHIGWSQHLVLFRYGG